MVSASSGNTTHGESMAIAEPAIESDLEAICPCEKGHRSTEHGCSVFMIYINYIVLIPSTISSSPHTATPCAMRIASHNIRKADRHTAVFIDSCGTSANAMVPGHALVRLHPVHRPSTSGELDLQADVLTLNRRGLTGILDLMKRSPLGSSSPVAGISPQAGLIVSITSACRTLSRVGRHTIKSVLLVAIVGSDVLEVEMTSGVIVVVDIEALVALVSRSV